MPVRQTTTVIKPDLAKRVVARLKAEETAHTNVQAVIHVMDALGEEVKNALLNGENVLLLGLGTLMLTERSARPGSNPLTGVPMTVPAMYRPKLKASSPLKKALKAKMAEEAQKPAA